MRLVLAGVGGEAQEEGREPRSERASNKPPPTSKPSSNAQRQKIQIAHRIPAINKRAPNQAWSLLRGLPCLKTCKMRGSAIGRIPGPGAEPRPDRPYSKEGARFGPGLTRSRLR